MECTQATDVSICNTSRHCARTNRAGVAENVPAPCCTAGAAAWRRQRAEPCWPSSEANCARSRVLDLSATVWAYSWLLFGPSLLRGSACLAHTFAPARPTQVCWAPLRLDLCDRNAGTVPSPPPPFRAARCAATAWLHCRHSLLLTRLDGSLLTSTIAETSHGAGGRSGTRRRPAVVFKPARRPAGAAAAGAGRCFLQQQQLPF